MIAYKFLRSGRRGPFSGFEWPAPGVWVHADRHMVACRRGVHGCRIEDLPWWLCDELWEIELDGRVEVDEHKIFAPAGRLRSRVEGWTPACAQEYADACAWRAHKRAAQALTRAGHASASAELAACATLDDVLLVARQLADSWPNTKISLTIAGDGAEGYAAERAWQSRWLAGRLGLRPAIQSVNGRSDI